MKKKGQVTVTMIVPAHTAAEAVQWANFALAWFQFTAPNDQIDGTLESVWQPNTVFVNDGEDYSPYTIKNLPKE
jgi:hypothetical protein